MDTASAPYIPLSERFNFRMIGFALVVLLLVGYPMYVYVDSAVSGGIKEAGDGYKAVELQAMSSFLFDQNKGTIDDVPAKWRELDGQKVILEGKMVDYYYGLVRVRGTLHVDVKRDAGKVVSVYQFDVEDVEPVG